MKLSIRDLDLVTVKKIDFLASRNNSSRNNFLKIILENLVVTSSLENHKVNLNLDLEKNNILLKKVDESLNGYEEKEKRLFDFINLMIDEQNKKIKRM